MEQVDNGVQSTTDRILTVGVRSLQGCVGMYTLQVMSAGLWMETSTLPLGRSSKWQRSACWNGHLRRRLNFVFLMMWAWTLKDMSPTCMVRDSAHPTIQLVVPFAPSISIVHCVFMGTPRASTRSHWMMTICKLVLRITVTLMSSLTVTSSSCKGRQKAGGCSDASMCSCICTFLSAAPRFTSGLLFSTHCNLSFSTMSLQM